MGLKFAVNIPWISVNSTTEKNQWKYSLRSSEFSLYLRDSHCFKFRVYSQPENPILGHGILTIKKCTFRPEKKQIERKSRKTRFCWMTPDMILSVGQSSPAGCARSCARRAARSGRRRWQWSLRAGGGRPCGQPGQQLVNGESFCMPYGYTVLHTTEN